MKKHLSGFLIVTMMFFWLFSGEYMFLIDLPNAAFAATAKADKATSSAASSALNISTAKERVKKNIFPRFRLILEKEEIFSGQKVKVTLDGVLETDELTFRIKERDSAIEEEGEELNFEECFADGNIILYTHELEAGNWQIMAAITRKNNSTSLVCDLAVMDKVIDTSEMGKENPSEENVYISLKNRKTQSGLSIRSEKESFDANLSVMNLFAPYIGGGTWTADGENWKFLTESGSFAANQWALIDGRWYIFDLDGRMMTGWQNIKQKWYFMNEDGTMATGWILINDKWYCLSSSGETYVSTTTPDGYPVNDNGEWIGK